MFKYRWYCRWCGNTYRPVKQTDRDGFDTKACKQALYRAHKKYVTVELISIARTRGRPVTRKTRKICPLCSKEAIRVVDKGIHKQYIHKESVRGKGGRACIVPTPKTRKKSKSC